MILLSKITLHRHISMVARLESITVVKSEISDMPHSKEYLKIVRIGEQASQAFSIFAVWKDDFGICAVTVIKQEH